MKVKSLYIIMLVVMAVAPFSLSQTSADGPDLSPILDTWLEYTDAQNFFYHYISHQAQHLLQQRREMVSQIKTKEQWQARQQEIRKTIIKLVGPFPERTPLNARITGRVDSANYYIEHILLEPQPENYMSACMFIPKGLIGKLPTVIYCSGHSPIGFRNPKYQHIIMNLVKKGFIVFAFDPMGQGERLMYVDPETGESLVGRPTREHSYPGAQCFLIGSSAARYYIWDALRAIDYVYTRPEVDTTRVGMAGRSGGGTQSAYIAALDNRVDAIATECYITNFTRLFQTRGPQDAEQNFFHGILSGIDHPDLLTVWAPKPLLMISATRDFFSIEGVRETAQDLTKVYQAFDAEESFSKVEDDAEHASTKANREALYAFFQKYLDNPGDCTDTVIDTLTHGELQITQTGQIQTSMGGRTVFDINRKEAKQVFAKRSKEIDVAKIRQAAAYWNGYQPPPSEPNVVYCGAYNQSDMRLERYFMHGDGEYVIPFYIIKPLTRGPYPAVLYLHPDGKSAAARQPVVKKLVENGFAVVLPDLLGRGEVGPGVHRGDAYEYKQGNANYNLWFGAIQIGRSLVGIHAGDINSLMLHLQARDDIQDDAVRAIGEETMAPVLLHAAVLSNKFCAIDLIKPLGSYESLVMNKYYIPKFMLAAVPGGLKDYDLPELCAVLAPTPLRIINPVNNNDKYLSTKETEKQYTIVKKHYMEKGVASNLQLKTELTNQDIADLLAH